MRRLPNVSSRARRMKWTPKRTSRWRCGFYHAKNAPLAKKYFERAQTLNPDDWNYHRQDWSFTPGEAGAKWLDKFQKLEEPYYPKLELKPKPKPDKP